MNYALTMFWDYSAAGFVLGASIGGLLGSWSSPMLGMLLGADRIGCHTDGLRRRNLPVKMDDSADARRGCRIGSARL